jgi:branched-chain amino acid transport system permease protein
LMLRLSRYWWLFVAAFLAAFPALAGDTSSFYCGVLTIVGIYMILAVGLDLLMGYAGQISVGHASFFALGAYSTAILTTKYGMSPLVALLAGLAVSGSVAWLMGRPILALKEYYLAMATLAFNVIVVTLITALEGFTGGGMGLGGIPAFSVLGLSLSDPVHYYYFVYAVVFLVIGASLAVVRSPFGQTLLAVHSDEEAASHFGINCASYKTRVFVFAAVLASLSGSLLAHHLRFIAPNDFNIMTSISIIVMTFLGGIGTVIGPALGAAFMKLLPEISYYFHDYEILFEGLILIVILIFMPKGFYGLIIGLKNLVLTKNGNK